MKLIKIISHPVVVSCIFLMVLISGEQFGGFYLIYLLLGLPHGALHAVLALVGILCMLLGYRVNLRQNNIAKPLLYVSGDVIFIIALITFFKESKGYNDATFHQTIPVITFVLLGICIISNILISTSMFLKYKAKTDVPYRTTS